MCFGTRPYPVRFSAPLLRPDGAFRAWLGIYANPVSILKDANGNLQPDLPCGMDDRVYAEVSNARGVYANMSRNRAYMPMTLV